MASDISAVQPVGASRASPLPAPGAERSGARRSAPRAPEAPETGVSYEVNRETGDVVIKVLDRVTQKIIREIPPEVMQRISAAMRELAGPLLDRKG